MFIGIYHAEAVYIVVREATRARSDMTIITMGLGDWIDEYELKAISSDSYEKNLIMVPRFDRLRDFVERMRNMLCNSEYNNAGRDAYTIIRSLQTQKCELCFSVHMFFLPLTIMLCTCKNVLSLCMSE